MEVKYRKYNLIEIIYDIHRTHDVPNTHNKHCIVTHAINTHPIFTIKSVEGSTSRSENYLKIHKIQNSKMSINK